SQFEMHTYSDGTDININTTATVGRCPSINWYDDLFILNCQYDSVAVGCEPQASPKFKVNGTVTITNTTRIYEDVVLGRSWIAGDSGSVWVNHTGSYNLSDDLYVGGNATINIPYGEMWNYTSNITAWRFDLVDPDVYYNLTNLRAGNLNGFTFTSATEANGGSYLTAYIEGLYKIDASISFKGQTAGGLHGIGVVKNFKVADNRQCYARRKATGLVGNVGITCMMNLAAGDKINMQIEDEVDPVKDIFIHTVNLNLIRIGDIT
ncbi:MAG TPA: hypothetical protein VMV86_03715, partial [Methanosarcinales archaeon]|nr:hypothetical protein [Methanosarcinales archaeon]